MAFYNFYRHLHKVILLIFLAIFIHSGIENIIINNKIKSFIENATYVSKTENYYYYEVRKENTVDKAIIHETRNVFGTKGDILVTKESPFPKYRIIDTVFSFLWGGHASLVLGDGEEVIEVLGNDINGENVVKISENNWSINPKETIGLRVNNANLEDYSLVIDQAKDYLGDKYNYFFIFNNKNAHYCTDFVSKAWKNIGFSIDYDFFITTVNDIIISNETYIFLYKYVDSNGDVHVYYINEE